MRGACGMTNPGIRMILWISLVIGALLAFLSLLVQNGEHAGGVVAGALIGSLNFYFLALMIQKIVDDSPNKTGLLLRFLFKYGLVGVLVAATIFIFRVSPLGFAVGISNVVLALVIGGVAGVFTRETD